MASTTEPRRSPSGQPSQPTHSATALDFAALPLVRDLAEPLPDGRRRTFWAPDVAGLDFLAQVEAGEELGLTAVEFMAADAGLSTALLGWAIGDMDHGPKAPDRGAQIGFISVFAVLAIWAAQAGLLPAFRRHLAERREAVRAIAAAEAEEEQA